MFYLDSSIALQAIFPTPDQARLLSWFSANTTGLVSSRLLRTEVVRVLRRENRPLDSAQWLLDRVNLIYITRYIHARAESIERHIKTLDALHLATALSVNSVVTVLTHDQAMRDAAESLSLKALDLIPG